MAAEAELSAVPWDAARQRVTVQPMPETLFTSSGTDVLPGL